MDDVTSLARLIRGGCHCISIVTHEEQYALEIVKKAADEVHRDLAIWSLGYGVRDGKMMVGKAEARTDTAGPGLCHMAMMNNLPICVTLDLSRHLKDHLTFRILRDTIDRMVINNSVLIMIDPENNLPSVVRSHATPFELSLPDEKEIEQIIRDTLQEVHRKTPIEIGITQKGLTTIIKNLRGLTRRQARNLIEDCVNDDQRFDDNDVNIVMAGKRRMLQADGLLTYIRTPLDLDEIGGMDNLKTWLRKRKDAFSKEAEEYGLKPPRGVLMLGVQGAGKSLCAKAIATAWQLPLLQLDPGNLYNSYIGESERNLRKALQQTEMMSPVVLWIDEIEKAFASAASQSTDGGLSKRMFGTLLNWMQEHEDPVFLVATANDIAALPPELLRKGRFDEIFFVGLPKTEARQKIFEIHLTKRNQQLKDFDIKHLAEKTQGYSGAEIEQAVISAMHESFANKSCPTTELIVQEVLNSPPISVTMAEKINALYKWADGRCVSAD